MEPVHTDEPLGDADIERIVKQVQDGQQEPFRLLVKQYQRRIHVYCYHMLGQQQEAEDAVQDIFIKCYQHIDRYKEHISFTAWLYKISYNHCINLLQKRNARHKIFSLYLQQQLSAKCETDYSSLVGEILGHLSSEDRNLILLRVVDERSFEEIGQIIGCKPAAARKKYERIKKRLRPLRSWQMEGHANETY
ncbi:RNA polymerase sigma factor [Paenibacillus sp.]|jgi:RNA polymerase sigma-70 factor (ECF subfamily)|uniref:RNA polymerase sigma factor n=1 Tax=Paenibacillus sp. TaxID=58172 RepID=UPI00281DF225|nr:RNA polymerase sigma factor [Paenibacillus sp.]MDR0270575.1 RNA polymerase sigma factor [Paenibacillus sp.]